MLLDPARSWHRHASAAIIFLFMALSVPLASHAQTAEPAETDTAPSLGDLPPPPAPPSEPPLTEEPAEEPAENPIEFGDFSGSKQYRTGPEAGTTYDIGLRNLSENNGTLTGRYSLAAVQGSTAVFEGTKRGNQIRFKINPPANPSCTHDFSGIFSGDSIGGDFTTKDGCNGSGTWTVRNQSVASLPPPPPPALPPAPPTLPSKYTLTVTIKGLGTVTATPPSLTCAGADGCGIMEKYTADTTVRLGAEADEGFVFDGWGGDADCKDGTVTMSHNITTRP